MWYRDMGCVQPSVSSLSIPRLRKVVIACSTPEVSDDVLALLHHNGKKQVNPPALLPVTSGPSCKEVTRAQTSLHRVQENDTQWLSYLFQPSPPSPPMAWSDFNSQLARKLAETVKQNHQPTCLGGEIMNHLYTQT